VSSHGVLLLTKCDCVMSFQRHRQKTEAWRAWLRKHRNELAGCGLPESVLRDKPHWNRFLDHGYCPETGWRLALLSPHAARNLYHFLLAECGDSVDGWLLGQLRRVVLQEWLTALEPNSMLACLGKEVSERKLRLWAVACCSRAVTPLADLRLLSTIDVVARFADGLVSVQELAAAGFAAMDSWDELDGNCHPAAIAVGRSAASRFGTREASACAVDAARAVVGAPYPYTLNHAPYAAAMAREKLVQCDLLRCVFGPLSHQSAAEDEPWLVWNGGCAKKMAAVIYEEQRFSDLPVLADALEEANCPEEDLLAHLRGAGPHSRGCFVVDALLGKS
jgi:hypothetical protein